MRGKFFSENNCVKKHIGTFGIFDPIILDSNSLNSAKLIELYEVSKYVISIKIINLILNGPILLVNVSLNDSHQMLKYQLLELSNYAFTFFFIFTPSLSTNKLFLLGQFL